MIPVMFMGVVVRKKRYTWKEYVCVLLITCGVALFSYKPKASVDGHTTPAGVMLLIASLAMDGFTGSFQVRTPEIHFPAPLFTVLCVSSW